MLAAALPAAAGGVLQALLLAVVAELRVLRAHKPRVALPLPAAGGVLRAPLLLEVAAVLRVELLEVVVVLLELRRLELRHGRQERRPEHRPGRRRQRRRQHSGDRHRPCIPQRSRRA